MGMCEKCGRQTGFGVRTCPACEAGRSGKVPLVEERQEQRERVAAGRAREIQDLLDTLLARVEKYGRVSLFRSVYVPVDSVIGDEHVAKTFDISAIQALGLSGWEFVSVVPRTKGVELTNVSIGSTTGHTYGGGMGGNVIGVHVLMQRVVRKPVPAEMHDELRVVLGEQVPTRLPGKY